MPEEFDPANQKYATQENSINPPREAVESIQERHPDWPKIHINLELASHGNASDWGNFPDRLQSADVYLYEGVNHSEDNAAVFQRVANGELSSDAFLQQYPHSRGKIWETIARGLDHSKITVGSVDLTSYNVEENELNHQIDVLASQPIDLNGDFSTAVEKFTQVLRGVGVAQRQRERIIVSKMEQTLQNIIDANPHLKNRPDLNVMMTMGSYHTALRSDLGKAGFDVDSSFPVRPLAGGVAHPIQRKFAYGEDARVESDDVARAIAENITFRFVDATFKNAGHENVLTEDVFAFCSEVAGSMNYEQCEALFNFVARRQITADQHHFIESLKFPSDPDELHQMAEAYRNRAKRHTGQIAIDSNS